MKITPENTSSNLTRTNLVLGCWTGRPRHSISTEYFIDRYYYIKTQLKYLERIPHTLSQVTFAINPSKGEDPNNSFWQNIPTTICNGQTKIVLLFREENTGGAYGLFDLTYRYFRQMFDYYIFGEDDCVFVLDNFDTVLIDIFNSKPNCGYLCGQIAKTEDPNKTYAAIPLGISHSSVIEKIFKANYNSLPFTNKLGYWGSGSSQVKFTNAFVRTGYNIYDYLEYCQVYHWEFNRKQVLLLNSAPALAAHIEWLDGFGDSIDDQLKAVKIKEDKME